MMLNRLDINNRHIKHTQILLSAISTGGFLGSMITNQFILTCIGGIFSTALLFLNLYFKDFNLAEDSKQHRIVSDNLWLIREQYLSLLTDFEVLSEEDITAKRDELQKLTFEVYNKSPKTDAKSYAEAQKALKTEEEQFFTPEEIFPIPVTVLVENEYALGTANGFESFRTHWTIKNINLLQVLQDAGIKMWG